MSSAVTDSAQSKPSEVVNVFVSLPSALCSLLKLVYRQNFTGYGLNAARIAVKDAKGRKLAPPPPPFNSLAGTRDSVLREAASSSPGCQNSTPRNRWKHKQELAQEEEHEDPVISFPGKVSEGLQHPALYYCLPQRLPHTASPTGSVSTASS